MTAFSILDTVPVSEGSTPRAAMQASASSLPKSASTSSPSAARADAPSLGQKRTSFSSWCILRL